MFTNTMLNNNNRIKRRNKYRRNNVKTFKRKQRYANDSVIDARNVFPHKASSKEKYAKYIFA